MFQSQSKKVPIYNILYLYIFCSFLGVCIILLHILFVSFCRISFQHFGSKLFTIRNKRTFPLFQLSFQQFAPRIFPLSPLSFQQYIDRYFFTICIFSIYKVHNPLVDTENLKIFL